MSLLAAYSFALLVSAALLFSIQPMFAKLVLPLLGGTPAVWNTCMVFYQAILFAGYVYAHYSAKLLGIRRQAMLHMSLLVLAALMLPPALPDNLLPAVKAAPAAGLFWILLSTIGLPFFVISATAPMLQKWFSHTEHPSAKDPYFLYAASNVGSIGALLSYPVLMEPYLPLKGQAAAWTAGYLVLAVLIAASGLFIRKVHASAGRLIDSVDVPLGTSAAVRDVTAGPTFALRLKWMAVSFVPSSLLLGVTSFITTDIAAVPLLWVVPLSLYLFTFVIVFSRKHVIKQGLMMRAQAVLVPLLVITWSVQSVPWVAIPIHLAAFFASAMVCHAELAQSRPHASHLTEFYIWMSAGGILGGAFNALAAPVLFDTLLEYPLALVLACLLRPAMKEGSRGSYRNDLILPLILFAVLAGLGLSPETGLFKIGITGLIIIAAASAVYCLRLSVRPLRFGLGVFAILLAGAFWAPERGEVLFAERSFFGVLKVYQRQNAQYHTLYHGRILHGAQGTSVANRTEPLTYYHRQSPVGQVFEVTAKMHTERKVAVIGLGAGTMASYAEPGERWVFYEIDPAVTRIAQSPEYFTYLQDSRSDTEIVIGDARLSLLEAPEGYYDLIVIDAFNSDSIPMHLLTKEALLLYESKLAKRGMIALHISNRYLDLRTVL